jgi:outer membrane protein assembly factor BamB
MNVRIVFAAVAACFAFSSAQAATVAALVGDNSLTMVDTSTGKAGAAMKIDGVSGKILGIDVRPKDGMLYALAEDGTVYTIDAKTGKATMKVKLEQTLPAGVTATVDFNPVADKLRVMGSDGTSLRCDVDTGKVTKDGSHKYADADSMKGSTPMVVAGAYTNSMAGAKETVLYNVDGSSATLVKQVPPNDGVLNTIGKLGVSVKSAAMDIATDASGANTAFLMSGKTLYTVDVASGKATQVKDIDIKGEVRDIAILPAA